MKKMKQWTMVVGLVCAAGCYAYQDVCECDRPAEAAEVVKPDDAKPPRSGMPSYQAEGVKLYDAPSMAYDDAKQDKEKVDADSEGKKAAGIK